MSAEIVISKREFFFSKKTNGKEEVTNLPDPDPTMSETEVMDFYAGRYPELTAGVIKDRVQTSKGLKIEIGFTVGDKG